MAINRRSFLTHVAAGGTIVTLPAVLQGCATPPAQIIAEPVPDNVFLTWFGIDQASIGRVMSALTANGADIADTFFELSTSNRIVFERGAISDMQTDVRQGAGLRVINAAQTGFASTDDLSLPALLAAAKATAGATVPGTTLQQRPLHIVESGGLYTTTLPWSDVDADRKTALLRMVDARARAADASVESVTIRFEDAEQSVMIATLDGKLVMDKRPLTRMSLVVTAAKGGAQQTGFATIAARQDIGWYREARVDALVDRALERTLVQFDARRAPVGEMPVVLAAGTGGVLLHEAIGHSLEADLNQDGSSAYAGRIGDKVAEAFVTVVDDARRPHESGAINVDDEGCATRRTTLIEKGVLKSYLHDRVTARHDGVESTGSGRRDSYEHMPMPRMTCTYLENGPHSRDEIIAAVGDGVICETFTGGNVQIGAGDFSFRVKNGWRIENGQVTGPLKDFSISGNGPEMLSRITMVGDDMQMDAGGWTCGKNGQNVPVSEGMPTVLVSSMSVAA